MTWEVWSKAEPLRLARYATPDAMRWFDGKINYDDLSSQPGGLFETVRAIYNALRERQALINYAPEKYHYLEPFQEIRTPAEILGDPHEGTCLDLALLFSGLCLGHNLLPVLIVLDGHALAAVSLKNRLPEWNRNRAGRDLFEGEDSQVKGLLASWQQEQCERFYQLVNSEVFLPIECTGLAHSQRLGQQQPPFPESLGRQDDGTMTFERAIEGGREQLNLQDKRPFQFALDIAIAQANVGGPYSLSGEATVVAPTFWGNLVQSTVITAGGNVQITLTNGNSLSVRPEDWPDFTDLIARSTHWFSGRGFVFEAVSNFLQQSRRGYFHIIADAGLGKTAIAAELTRRYRSPAYFLSTSAGRASPEQVLNALSAQLIVCYALPHTYLPARAGETSDMFYQLLKEAAAESERHLVVVVIDALDEADSPPQGHNWLHLPDDLPEGVYVIMTHRPGEYPIAYVAGLSVKELTISWDDQLHQDDIKTYLLTQTERPEIRQHLELVIPRINTEYFVTSLQKASQGNFMYLSYVLEDIAQCEPGSASFNLETLPLGLRGYYEQFWSRIAEAKERGVKERAAWLEWRDLYRPVIMLLGAAGESVTPQWLADLTGLDEDEIRGRALLHWQRFLSQERRKDQQTTWRVIHQSFVDFLASKETEGLRQAHCRAAEYYATDPARWKAHGDYAHRHLISHLVQAGMFAELETLIERRDWYLSQREYDPSRHTYARNVERAIAAAEEQALAGVPAVVGWSLLYGTVTSLATDVPVEALEALALTGEIEQALRYAELISEPYQQTEAYWRIGQRGGTEAWEALMRAMSMVERIVDHEARTKARTEVAGALVQAGRVEQALGMVENINERDELYTAAEELMAAVARSLIELGEVARALDVSVRIRWEAPLVEILAMLAPALVRLNDRNGLARAFERAKQMEHHLSRAKALATVGVALSQVGDKKAARSALTEAQLSIKKDEKEFSLDDSNKAKALASVGVAFAQIGNAETAQTTLAQAMSVAMQAGDWSTEEKTRDEERAKALAAVAVALAQVGDWEGLDQALGELMQIPYGYRRDNALVTVAGALAQVGKVDQALVTAGEISTGESQTKVWAAIATTFTKAGDRDGLNQLLEVVKQIRWEADRMKALKTVAASFARIGDQLGVANVISAAEEMHDERAQLEALAAISVVLAQMEDRDKARSLLARVLAGAELIGHQASLVKALVATAPALAQVGDREGIAHALQIAEQLKDNELRAQALAALAPALAQVGDREGVKHTLTMAEQFKGSNSDLDLLAEVLAALAPALAQVGDREGVKRALTMVEQLLEEKDPRVSGLSAEALAALALALAQVGDRELLTHTLMVVEQLEVDVLRAIALVGMAPALARIGDREGLGRVLQMALELIDHDYYIYYHYHAEALAAIALILAQTGDQESVAHALLRIEQLEDDHASADALAALAPALAQLKDQKGLARAITKVEQFENHFASADALAALAPALAEIRDRNGLARALQLAVELGHDRSRATPLAALAPALARIGDREGLARALRIAMQMGYDDLNKALPPVVGALVLVGERDRALKALLTKKISKTYPWKSLIAVATTLASKGDRTGLIRAWEAIEQIEGEAGVDSVKALAAVAVALAQVGDRKSAKDILTRATLTAGREYNVYHRAEALGIVATALAQVGYIERALQIAESIPTSDYDSTKEMRDAALAVVAGIVSHAHSANTNTIDWLLTAFRFAREHGREDVFDHVAAFVPIFKHLGITSSVWRRIYVVETLFSVAPRDEHIQ
jgi:hypothetical protein